MSLELILGPPGTGKTTTLLNIIDKALEEGMDPQRIGYFTFSRKANQEGITRAIEKFPDLTKKDFPFYKTLHSLAYNRLQIKKQQVFEGYWEAEFAKWMGLDLDPRGQDKRMLSLTELARVTGRTLDNLAVEHDVDPWRLDWLNRGAIEFKKEYGILDFPDMISRLVNNPLLLPQLDLVIVDEVQDISASMWQLVYLLNDRTPRAVVAGDDDQAIYEWNGADVKQFVNLSVKTTILNQSYRVPRAVQVISQRIVGRIQERKEKEWNPRDAEGSVAWINDLEELDMSSGSWFVLARTQYHLDLIREVLDRRGMYYERQNKRSVGKKLIEDIQVWEAHRKGDDVPEELLARAKKHTEGGTGIWYEAFTRLNDSQRGYIRMLLRSGEDLTKPPRIKLSTIHGAKGGEADNVVMLRDVTKKVHSHIDDDEEHRVWYVGATRTKENLYLVDPRGKYCYDI